MKKLSAKRNDKNGQLSVFITLLIIAAIIFVSLHPDAKGLIDPNSNYSFKFSKQLIKYNHGGKITPKYVVIHETDNFRKSADAQSHVNYNNNDPNATSSANFYVDDKEVIQAIEMGVMPYSVGKKRNESQKIHNGNVIGIEMCVNEGSNYLKTVDNTIRLINEIILPQAKLNGWTLEVVQHEAVYGKDCPHKLRSGEYGITWDEFIKKIDQ